MPENPSTPNRLQPPTFTGDPPELIGYMRQLVAFEDGQPPSKALSLRVGHARIAALHHGLGLPSTIVEACDAAGSDLFDTGLRATDATNKKDLLRDQRDLVHTFAAAAVGLPTGRLHASFITTYWPGSERPAPPMVAAHWAKRAEALAEQEPSGILMTNSLMGSLCLLHLVDFPGATIRNLPYPAESDVLGIFKRRELIKGVSHEDISRRLRDRKRSRLDADELSRRVETLQELLRLEYAAHLLENAQHSGELSPASNRLAQAWFANYGPGVISCEAESLREAELALHGMHAAIGVGVKQDRVITSAQALYDTGLMRAEARRQMIRHKALEPLQQMADDLRRKAQTRVHRTSTPPIPETAPAASLPAEVLSSLTAEAEAASQAITAFNGQWMLSKAQRQRLSVLRPVVDQLALAGYGTIIDGVYTELIPQMPLEDARAITDIIALLGGMHIRTDATKSPITYDAAHLAASLTAETELMDRRGSFIRRVLDNNASSAGLHVPLPVPLAGRIEHLKTHWDAYEQLLKETSELPATVRDRYIAAVRTALFPATGFTQ